MAPGNKGAQRRYEDHSERWGGFIFWHVVRRLSLRLLGELQKPKEDEISLKEAFFYSGNDRKWERKDGPLTLSRSVLQGVKGVVQCRQLPDLAQLSCGLPSEHRSPGGKGSGTSEEAAELKLLRKRKWKERLLDR